VLVTPIKILFLGSLRPLPFTSIWGLCDLWEIQAKCWVRSSLWALELCEVIFVAFVTLRGDASLMARSRPRAPMLWWAIEKFVKVRFASKRKETRASEVRKVVERDLAWSWHSVCNSSYRNGDVGITDGDSELRQTNPRVNSLVCIFVFLLFELLEWLIVSIDSIGCINRLLYLWSIP
jgi:hypothetical protein